MSEKKMDVGFLDAVAGQGFENMGAGEVATPMLLIAQAMSDVTQNGKIPAGHFYNSITGEDYGDSVDVIVCYFDKVWIEWKPNQGGFVGRYPVGSLEGVTGDVYTGMKHGENDILETWQYLVILPDHPEAGYMVFSSTRGNLRYLKAWNTQMENLRTSGGKRAPLFAAVWNLKTGKDQNKQGKQYFSCNEDGKSSIKMVGWITQEIYNENVLPARTIATQALALADNSAETAAIEDKTETEF
jgi:hypothetical protein